MARAEGRRYKGKCLPYLRSSAEPLPRVGNPPPSVALVYSPMRKRTRPQAPRSQQLSAAVPSLLDQPTIPPATAVSCEGIPSLAASSSASLDGKEPGLWPTASRRWGRSPGQSCWPRLAPAHCARGDGAARGHREVDRRGHPAGIVRGRCPHHGSPPARHRPVGHTSHRRQPGGLAFSTERTGRDREWGGRRPRLRDPGRAGPRRHGRRLQGPAASA